MPNHPAIALFAAGISAPTCGGGNQIRGMGGGYGELGAYQLKDSERGRNSGGLPPCVQFENKLGGGGWVGG